jgi:hypothetical protein
MDRAHERVATEDSHAAASEDGAHASPIDAIRSLGDELAELKAYVGYFVTAKIDSVKQALRSAAIYAVLGILAVALLGAVVVMAAVLLCIGAARGLSVLFGGMQWLGDLVAGAALLILLGGAAWMGMRWYINQSRAATMRKYEDLKRQQRRQYGHDIDERARSASTRPE